MKNVGVNIILNQRILSFANFDRFFMRLGLVKLSANTLQRLLDAAPDEKIVEAGTVAARDTPKSIMLSKSGKVTFEMTLEYIKLLSDFANLFEYSITNTPSGKVINLFHRFGPKGSLLYSSYIKALFEEIDYAPKIRTGDHSVDFKIISRKDDVITF